MRFISPKTDFAFKKIFGSEQSKDILISFLNAIIYSGEEKIPQCCWLSQPKMVISGQYTQNALLSSFL